MKHILIISQAQINAKAISLALQSPEIEVSQITPNDCILDRCRTQHIELLIFLSLTPYFASMNIIEHLHKSLSYTPQVYVIAHSCAQSTILSLLECGVDQYMTYPLNLNRLRNKVFTLLHQ